MLLAMASRTTMALTLAELEADPHLTPESFIRHFADFKFELGRTLRTPEAFLESRSGDCDDFAALAAIVLRQKGYNTKLVVVHMSTQVHVICYVAEAKGYLDFNCRKLVSPLMKCDAGLGAIGDSVARYFKDQWRSASEFILENGVRRFVLTEFH
jgi:hypothetical protein